MRYAAKSWGELALIEEIRQASAARPMGRVRLGVGDDCAILRIASGLEMLVTTDLCLEERHFNREWHTPESAGHRCLARGLSDLAAMGAKPVAAFLSLAVPSGLDRRWINRFFTGLRALADATPVPLAGGDTARASSDGVVADIVLIGSAPTGQALLRSGARPGDVLYVTGSLGGAAAELVHLKKTAGKARIPGMAGRHPQLFPSPRVQVGGALLRRGLATACIDISDGLSTDLGHLCAASEVAAEIRLDRLPIHPLVKGRLNLALHGGEDYELLFASRKETKVPRSIGGISITEIGSLRGLGKGPPVIAIDAEGNRDALETRGWEHSFR